MIKTLAYVFLAVAFIGLSANSSAQDVISDAEASEIYADLKTEVAILTNQNKNLSDVRVLLMADCREQSENVVGEELTMYCDCGAVVTVALWMQNAEMQNLLASYNEKPSEKKLSAFLDYQGPELYEPLCRKALVSN